MVLSETWARTVSDRQILRWANEILDNGADSNTAVYESVETWFKNQTKLGNRYTEDAVQVIYQRICSAINYLHEIKQQLYCSV